jgi:hypothetical protein
MLKGFGSTERFALIVDSVEDAGAEAVGGAW